MFQQRHRLCDWFVMLSLGCAVLAGCASGSSTSTTGAVATGTSVMGTRVPGTQQATATETRTGTRTPTTKPQPTATFPPTTATGTPLPEWVALEQKPLHLPTVAPGDKCPVTPTRQNVTPNYQYSLGQGPLYLVGMRPGTVIQAGNPVALDPGSTWNIAQMFWDVSATLNGPAIIRGHQIDGKNLVGFNGGIGQTSGNRQNTEPILNELRLMGMSQWNTYNTFLRIQAAGCYAFQTDTQSSSDVIVVQATVSN